MTGPDSAGSPSGLHEDATPAASGPADTASSPEQIYPPADTPVRRRVVLTLLGLTLVAVILVANIFGGFRHWVALHTGVVYAGPDKYYNFWSGFGSDLGEATLISAAAVGLYTGFRRVNCHTKSCWRVGSHPLDGTPYVLCRHHHPHVPSEGATHEHILEQHRRFKESEAAKGK